MPSTLHRKIAKPRPLVPPAKPRLSVASPPETDNWQTLRRAALHCEACPLYRHATQTVFGEGREHARIVLIGEQPGDQEDREGRPFVGPAGRLLDRALVEAGIDREKCYVTNAVKHFKWKERGKRRLHQKPDRGEITACRPWWVAELRLLQPEFIVLLGSTAAKAVLERDVKVTQERGHFVETPWSKRTLITVHPSSLLRMPDPETKAREFARFVKDLRLLRGR
jgi:DNA polymerase